MSQPLVNQPVSAGTDSHGFAWKPVLVKQINLDARLALCTDDFGKPMEIRCDIMAAKGNLPEPGEQWLVHRNYGIWTFGAIINGTTRGVEVSNVTDLTQTLAANATTAANATNAVQSATLGQVQAKGDLLAGTQAGTVVKQAVGSASQALVADPTSSTGLAYKDGLALVTPRTTAAATGRYVGNTSTGPPTGTGASYAVGDWVQAQDGHVWVCTTAGSPGSWTSKTNDAVNSINNNSSAISSLQNNVSTNDLRASGKHIWYANNLAVNGVASDVILTTWSTYYNDGVASLGGGGLFQFVRAGKWALTFTMQSDATQNGAMVVYITAGNPSAWGVAGNTWLQDRAYRGSGFAGAGYLTQNITWTGRVAPADAAQAFAVHTQWYCNTAAAVNATISYQMMLEYLGPA